MGASSKEDAGWLGGCHTRARADTVSTRGRSDGAFAAKRGALVDVVTFTREPRAAVASGFEMALVSRYVHLAREAAPRSRGVQTTTGDGHES